LINETNAPLSMVFSSSMRLDAPPQSSLMGLVDLKMVMTRWQKELAGKGWNSNYLSNHDQPRQVSRFGQDGQYRVESAKLLGTFLHMLQGTPYIYQGEEIGMTNVAFESIDDYKDIETVNLYHEQVDEKGRDPSSVMQIIHAKSRDNARTPMQWDAGAQAGFTTGHWLVNPNYQDQHGTGHGGFEFHLSLLPATDRAAQDKPSNGIWCPRSAPTRARTDLCLHPHFGRRVPAGNIELQPGSGHF
jgi:oligo-1,6-glucosidase